MKREFICAGAIVLLGLAASFAMAASKESDARAAIMKTDEEFSRAANERGVEGFASFVGEDFQSIRANSALIGKKEFVEGWRPLLTDAARKISWKPIAAVAARSGDFGYTIGAYEIRRTDGAAKTLVGSGKYVSVWRKQRDGAWKLILDTGVQDALGK